MKSGFAHKSETEHAHRKMLGFSQTPRQRAYLLAMANILENVPGDQEEPKLIVRKAPHAAVWSVWAVLEGTPSRGNLRGFFRRRGVKLDKYGRPSLA